MSSLDVNGAEFVGTGRANLTGGASTITAPKDVVKILDLDEDGRDIAYFKVEGAILLVPQSEVGLR